MSSTGTVVRFDRRRGYGFIQPDDGQEDVFVHQNNIAMEGFRFLQVGERVSYELEVGEKGMKAVSVGLLEPRQERPEDDRGPAPAPRAPRQDAGYRQPRAAGPGPGPVDNGRADRAGRKLERLISVLVAKGVISAADLEDPVAAAPLSAAPAAG